MMTSPPAIAPFILAAERAIDELRRQSGIVIREENGHAMANFPLEFLEDDLFSRFANPSLLITGARAQALGLSETPLRIDARGLTLAELQAIGDPLAAQPLPANLAYVPASEIDGMALRLAKYASLLPALLIAQESDAPAASWLSVSAEELRRYIAHPPAGILETARATLPVEGAEDSMIVSFRSRGGASVHLALIVGEPSEMPLTRIHSSCVTGDLLGSLRCDCGDQLALALAQIKQAGSGILLYLHQEGRGIGITNKLRAYRLQEQGFDTYDANWLLGFEEDERDFAIAAAMLRHLGITRIRMLTNNPHKLAAIETAGVMVAERIPLIAPSGRHNHSYLDAKARKSGHLF